MSDVPPELRPIVVASMGRSGSTLLLRLLDTHERITVWGEHNGFLEHLSRAYERIIGDPSIQQRIRRGHRNRKLVIGPLEDTGAFLAWVSPFTPKEFHTRMRDFVVGLFSGPLPPGTRWGFKEIRYGASVLELMATLFPDARFVFVTRDVRSQVRSRIQAFRGPEGIDTPEGSAHTVKLIDRFTKEWIRRHVEFRAFIEAHRNETMLLRYADLGEPGYSARPLFDFVGEAQPDETLVANVLATKSGTKEALSDGVWSPDQLVLLDELVAGFEIEHPEFEAICRFFTAPTS